MDEREYSFKPQPRRMRLSRAEKRRRRSRRILMRCAMLAVVAAGGVALAVGAFNAVRALAAGGTSGGNTSSSVSSATVDPAASANEGAASYADEKAPAYDLSSYAFNAADPLLLIVNGNSPLAEGYAVDTVTADDATGKALETTAAEAYRKMAAAAGADGVSLILCSGYRDYSYQQGLFEARVQKYLDRGDDQATAEAKAATIVARPGTSEHATGLAADIVTEKHQGLDSGFAKTDAFTWLTAHAADYGFILRYPEDRQAATGIVYEPWHWRYVGVPNACAIRASSLSLEEFVAVNKLA